ncbi:tRNA pseudouridine synthase 3, partial [Cladochytrium tenue]
QPGGDLLQHLRDRADVLFPLLRSIASDPDPARRINAVLAADSSATSAALHIGGVGDPAAAAGDFGRFADLALPVVRPAGLGSSTRPQRPLQPPTSLAQAVVVPNTAFAVPVVVAATAARGSARIVVSRLTRPPLSPPPRRLLFPSALLRLPTLAVARMASSPPHPPLPSTTTAAADEADYSTWSREALIARIRAIEAAAAAAPSPTTTPLLPQIAQPPPAASKDDHDRADSAPAASNTGGKKKKGGAPREFDFRRHACRPVALKVAYLGWAYHGLASQESDSVPTVEAALFDALARARLVPSRHDCNWSRCGRTDKGVSSFCQVFGLHIRSALPIGAAGTAPGWPWAGGALKRRLVQAVKEGVAKRRRVADGEGDVDGAADVEMLDAGDVGPDAGADRTDTDADADAATDAAQPEPSGPVPPGFVELPYVSILNRLLPPDIRVLGWTPAPPTFDARFDCAHRRYRYFFPAEQLDLPRMRAAAARFVGEHDFRFFCKIDPTKPDIKYVRNVLAADVRTLDEVAAEDAAASAAAAALSARYGASHPPGPDHQLHQQSPLAPDAFLVFEVTGHAFLWHQVRCMAAILLLVGRGLEQPALVDHLLDPAAHPAGAGRPLYKIGPELPLVLVECAYPPGLLPPWRLGPADPPAADAPDAATVATDAAVAARQLDRDADTRERLVVTLWSIWREHAIKAVQTRALLASIAAAPTAATAAVSHAANTTTAAAATAPIADPIATALAPHAAALATDFSGEPGGSASKPYVPIARRRRCESLEQRGEKRRAAAAAAATDKGGSDEV